jgi:hypothetical protein
VIYVIAKSTVAVVDADQQSHDFGRSAQPDARLAKASPVAKSCDRDALL